MGCTSSSESIYENGRPTIKAKKVTPGFKDRGNGLLFRLENGKQWAYYNDSKEYEFRVTVTFNEDCDIKALGKTTMETQEDGKVVATVTVYPTETAPFIEGRINGFSVKMDALNVSAEGKAFYADNRAAMEAAMSKK